MRCYYGNYDVWKLWKTDREGQIFCAARSKKDVDKFILTLDSIQEYNCTYKNFVDNYRDIHFNDIILN